MQYIHDVWVNWFEGEECGINVCSFFEWRKSDCVELMEQMPAIKLERKLYQYIENGLDELPEKLMSDIYQRSYIRKNKERQVFDYCAVLSDGTGILAIDTIGYTIPMRKSRLVPRHEQQVLNLIMKMKKTIYDFTYDESAAEKKKINGFSLDSECLIGLTRKERQLKKVLFLALENIYQSKNNAEIRYWFTELFPERYQVAVHLKFSQMWDELCSVLLPGWTEKHKFLCEKLIKGQSYLEQLWEIAMEEKPSMQ